ncbi:MAG: hypothetical protein ACLFS4_05125 [Opitutales bacterium]
MNLNIKYADFFQAATGNTPYDWQSRLALVRKTPENFEIQGD